MSEEIESEPELKKTRPSGKKLVIFVVLPLVLVLTLLGGGFFLGMFEGDSSAELAAHAKLPAPGHFVQLDEMVVNLNAKGKTAFLKLSVSLELDEPGEEAHVRSVMPRLVDNFQMYLRDLRIQDLQGAEGMYRVREELLARANAATLPVRVKDVLFREMLIQQ